MPNTENNKRIAKNTLLLYFRMMLTMIVSLYTVRVVLGTLGIVDYGLYNVVGGVVYMFSFLSGTMAAATQRFFAYELGRKNYDQLKKTFNMTITIYVIIAVVILILAETVGLWFLNTQMTIPANRMEAARWIYQFSILTFMMTMFTIPYNAAIIAHERMNIYAYISIIEVSLKLVIVYFLVIFSFDKLKLYAVLIFGVTTIITFIYRAYCKRKFIECRFTFYWNTPLFIEIVNYSGWNLFGALAYVFNNQGVNILLNIFFGPVVNAARAISFQINNAINQFVQNFMTATRPQIIKYYAAGEKQQMLNLVFQSSKLSFLLLFILSMPILIETNFILSIWIKTVPEYVVLFTRLIIISALIDSLSYPLMTAAQATGKIKKYQTYVGGVMIINLPVSYFFLKLGSPPQTIFYLAIITSIICLLLRLGFLKNMVKLPVMQFISNVIIPLSLSTVVAYILPYFLLKILDEGIMRFLITGITGLITSAISIYTIALTKNEKTYIENQKVKIIQKLKFK
jgi:O-antigen/teichoic acid export membrane protein